MWETEERDWEGRKGEQGRAQGGCRSRGTVGEHWLFVREAGRIAGWGMTGGWGARIRVPLG